MVLKIGRNAHTHAKVNSMLGHAPQPKVTTAPHTKFVSLKKSSPARENAELRRAGLSRKFLNELCLAPERDTQEWCLRCNLTTTQARKLKRLTKGEITFFEYKETAMNPSSCRLFVSTEEALKTLAGVLKHGKQVLDAHIKRLFDRASR